MVNCFFVREDDGLTLVDTNIAGSALDILGVARTLGMTIRRIVLTHAHIDHVGSTDNLIYELPDIEFIVGRRESRLLRRIFHSTPRKPAKSCLVFQV